MDKQAYRHPNDTVTIDHQVLVTVVHAAALSIEGVVRVGTSSTPFERVWGRNPHEDGIQVQVKDETVTVDIFVVLDAKKHLRQISSKVQAEIRRTMQQYVGMPVKTVNVTIEDIVFEHEN